MTLPVLVYGCETETMRKQNWNKIQTVNMKHLRAVSILKDNPLGNYCIKMN